MIAFLDHLNGWAWVLLILLMIPVLAYLVQLVRFVAKRARLYAALRRDSGGALPGVNLRPCRPLWWLFGYRTAYDFLLDLRDPATGSVTDTLAVKLIPTVMPGSEYNVADLDCWEHKLNFLVPMPYGVMRLDFGYRKCLPRRVDRVFRNAPAGAVRVYLFHPHPYALTRGRRGTGKSRPYDGDVTMLYAPVWQDGVLLTDLNSLRKLCGDSEVWGMLNRERGNSPRVYRRAS